MTRIIPACLLLSLAMIALPTSSVTAQDDQAAAFAESLKLAPEHAHFKKHLGKWTVDVTNYYPDPTNPETSKGSATITELFGGRYQQQHYKGTFFGMPFEGLGTTGYDKNKKKYVSTWIDNFETGIMTMEGAYDKKTKTLTEVGITTSPEGEAKMKNVIKDIDANSFEFKMFMIGPDGKEQLGMEFIYRRAK